MSKLNYIILSIVISTIFSSCASLPLYNSVFLSENIEDESFRYYDDESKVRYDIYNDKDNIYVKIATSDYLSQTKILKLGFNIWVDQKGKKNKDSGITFPLKQDFRKGMGKTKMGSNEFSDFSTVDNKNRLFDNLHKQFDKSKKVMTIIGLGDVEESEDINLEFEQLDIKADVKFNRYSELIYEAVIPIKYIFTEEKYNNGIYSLGIVSGKMSMDGSMKSNQGGGKGGGKGKGGGRSGGGRSGGGKSGGVKNQMSGLATPIDIWFKVKINKF